jgi:uncharacterized protein
MSGDRAPDVSPPARGKWRALLSSGGRGGRYSAARGLVEFALAHAYARDWPGRLWQRVPGTERVAVVEHRFAMLPEAAGPRRLRLAFASDLHLGPTTSPAVLDTAFAQLAKLGADVLLLGGDYVFLEASAARMHELHARVSALEVPLKLAVLGNHDLWTTHLDIEASLARAGVDVLINRSVRLRAPFADVAVVGLDEPWTGSPDADLALVGSEDAGLRVGLCHSPDGAVYLAERGVALLLCGHTHGGQIALPGPRPVILPPGPYSQRFAFGLHRVGAMHVVVSRGVGTTELPIRTYAPPDIVVVDLVPAA